MIRDQRTKALINTDSEALYKYKVEREKARKLVCMEQEIKSLKEKVDILYKLLEDRIEKNHGKINH
jgi:hypothetical protein